MLTRLITLLLALLPSLAHAEPSPLSLAFMPYLNAEHLLQKYTPLADYLSHALQQPVQIKVTKNYAEHMQQTGEDRLDIAFLGGSSYVVVTQQYGFKPLLVRYEFDHKPTFRAVIFVRNNSPLHNLKDLAGGTIAFGNKNSTLSSQVPLYMLMQAGITLETLGGYSHLRNHENVVLGVKLGDFVAGAVAEEVFVEKHDDEIRLLAASPPLSTHVFVTRATMPEALQDKIRQAFLALDGDSAEERAVLQAISNNLTAFVSVQDRDYDLHRSILAKVLPVLDK